MDLVARIDPASVQFVNHLGADFTGFAISEPYLNKNGNWEQIFENVVLEADSPNNPESVRLLPLVERLNISPDPPRESSQETNQQFIATEGLRGYEIRANFWEYFEETWRVGTKWYTYNASGSVKRVGAASMFRKPVSDVRPRDRRDVAGRASGSVGVG